MRPRFAIHICLGRDDKQFGDGRIHDVAFGAVKDPIAVCRSGRLRGDAASVRFLVVGHADPYASVRIPRDRKPECQRSSDVNVGKKRSRCALGDINLIEQCMAQR